MVIQKILATGTRRMQYRSGSSQYVSGSKYCRVCCKYYSNHTWETYDMVCSSCGDTTQGYAVCGYACAWQAWQATDGNPCKYASGTKCTASGCVNGYKTTTTKCTSYGCVNGWKSSSSKCSYCSGTGYRTTSSTCGSCSGTGRKTTTTTCTAKGCVGGKVTTSTTKNCTASGCVGGKVTTTVQVTCTAKGCVGGKVTNYTYCTHNRAEPHYYCQHNSEGKPHD